MMNQYTQDRSLPSNAVQKHFALLLGLFFLAGFMFMYLADFPVGGADGVVNNQNMTEAVEMEVAGVGWTGLLPDWMIELFGYGDLNVAGVGWTGIFTNWFTDLFAGVGWTGFLPTWLINLFGVEQTAGVGWTGIFDNFFINLFG